MQLLTNLIVGSSLMGVITALPQAAPPLPTSAFNLEGYAKTNPTGAVSGGAGGPTTTVSAASALQSAVRGTNPLNIVVKGSIALTGRLNLGSNKSLIGAPTGGNITKYGISITEQSNIIIRNIKFHPVKGNDQITISESKRIWIDHNEFFSDPDLKKIGPDTYDGQLDIVHASDWITVSWNYFHDHWKSSLVGNSDSNRGEDFGKLHVTYHHNYWRNEGTRGNAGRFGFQHLYNNFYLDFHYQAIHSRSDNQVLVEGNVFRGDTREALSTYGLVIPEDSPNTSPEGDFELDGYANLGALNDFGSAGVNITRTGTFTNPGYSYVLTPLAEVQALVQAYAGVGRI